MNVMRSILIKAMMNLREDALRTAFIVVNNLCHGLTDEDALDSVTAAIIGHLGSMEEKERLMTLEFIHSLKNIREVTV